MAISLCNVATYQRIANVRRWADQTEWALDQGMTGMNEKRILAMAVGAASSALILPAQGAMYLNHQGTGETLIFPLYSTESGNATLINLANATLDYKAVKVRVLEAQNSQEVLDFNLYLSPEDHFSFAISATEEGGGQLVTRDNSCTVPAIPADGVAFRNSKYADDKQETDPVDAADFDNTGIGRTQTGYLEIIEMGQLDPDSAPIIDTVGLADPAIAAINAAAAVTHGVDGEPANCNILVNAWSRADGVDGVWLAESRTTDLTGDAEFLPGWSGGGLYGYATLINVPEGTAVGYDAIAIADHVAADASGSDMHYKPGDIRPNFGDSALDTAAIVSVNGAAITVDFLGDYPSEATQRVQALNATMMASEIYNDYVTDPDIGAETDWLLTFPTRAFHINGTEPIEPFSQLWTGQSACEPSALSALDREESTATTLPDQEGPDFSPAPPTPPGPGPKNSDVPLCYESTLVQFGRESAASTSTITVGVNAFLDASNGWATLSLVPEALDSTLGQCDIDGDMTTDAALKDPCDRSINAGDAQLFGLPVVGFAIQKYVNGGPGANYSMAAEHKSCVAGSGTTTNQC